MTHVRHTQQSQDPPDYNLGIVHRRSDHHSAHALAQRPCTAPELTCTLKADPNAHKARIGTDLPGARLIGRPATSPARWQNVAAAHDAAAATAEARAEWNEATSTEQARARARLAERSCRKARCSGAQANALQQIWEPRTTHAANAAHSGNSGRHVWTHGPQSMSTPPAAAAELAEQRSLRDQPEESWASMTSARDTSSACVPPEPVCAQADLLRCDPSENDAAQAAHVLVATQQAESLQHMGPSMRRLLGLYRCVWRTPGTVCPDERDWDARVALAHAGRVDGAESQPLHGQVVRSAADLRAVLPELDHDRDPAFWQLAQPPNAPAVTAAQARTTPQGARAIAVHGSGQVTQCASTANASQASTNDWTTALASLRAGSGLASSDAISPALAMPRSEVLHALELAALGPRYASVQTATQARSEAPHPVQQLETDSAVQPAHADGAQAKPGQSVPSYMRPLQRNVKTAKSLGSGAEMVWLDKRQRALEARRMQRKLGPRQNPGAPPADRDGACDLTAIACPTHLSENLCAQSSRCGGLFGSPLVNFVEPSLAGAQTLALASWRASTCGDMCARACWVNVWTPACR